MRYLGLGANYEVFPKSQITITYTGRTKTKFVVTWGRTVNFSYCHRQSDCIVSLCHSHYHRLLLCVSWLHVVVDTVAILYRALYNSGRYAALVFHGNIAIRGEMFRIFFYTLASLINLKNDQTSLKISVLFTHLRPSILY